MPAVPLAVGDFIAISKLVYRIGVEIKQNAKSASDYQLLLVELESLDRALKWLQAIKPAQHELRKLDAIRAVACTCQQPLENFLAKIAKFEHRLGSFAARGRSFARVTRSLQWSMKYDEEVKALRAKLAPNVATITILLLTQTMDTLAIAEVDRTTMMQEMDAKLDSQHQTLHQVHQTSSSVAENQEQIQIGQESLHESVTNQTQTLSNLQSQAEELLIGQTIHEEQLRGQTEMLKSITEHEVATQSQLQDCKTIASSIDRTAQDIKGLIPSLLERVLGLMEIVTAGIHQMQNITTLLSQILSVATKFSAEMMQTVGNLLQAFCDLQRQVALLERWMPKQIDLPIVRFRDAFNDVRIFPFDLSREWGTFQQLVHATFTNKQGLHRVNMGQYFVTNAGNGQRIRPQFWRHAIRPGDELAMTMILDDYEAEDGYCPFKSCGASTVDAPVIGGGKVCSQCHRIATITPKKMRRSLKRKTPHDRTEDSTSDINDADALVELAVQLPGEQYCPMPTYGPLLVDLIEEDIELYHSVQMAEMLLLQEASEHFGDQKEYTASQEYRGEGAASLEQDNLLLSKVQVFVRNLQGETKIIRSDPSDTILSIKEELRAREGIPLPSQRLIFEGKCLRDGLTLADYNIHNDNTIHLTSGLQSSTASPEVDHEYSSMPKPLYKHPMPPQYGLERRQLRSPIPPVPKVSEEEYLSGSGRYIGEEIECQVKTLTGKTINLLIKNDSSVGAMKEELFKREGVIPECQRLIHAGRLLENQEALYRYNIRPHSILHLIVRLPPADNTGPIFLTRGRRHRPRFRLSDKPDPPPSATRLAASTDPSNVQYKV